VFFLLSHINVYYVTHALVMVFAAFREHRADITCFASSKNVVVSGSKDTCVIVWNLHSSSSTKRIDPTPRHILRAHGKSTPASPFRTRLHACLYLDYNVPMAATAQMRK
jgi:WD40 repeat protein